MPLTSFLWSLLALMDCTDPGQAQTLCAHGLGRGPGWGLLSLGFLTGSLGWQAAHRPVPSLCQAALPSDASTSWPPPVPSPQAGKGSDV